MANRPTIEIKFQPKGHKELVGAINKLAGAQTRLEKEQKKTGKGMTDITNKGRLLNNSFATIRSKLLLVSFAWGLVAMSMGKALKMFGEQEKVSLKLNNALGFNTVRLRKLASEMQNVTGVGDEVIISAQSILASFVKNEKQVAKLTTTILDLSAGLGIDLNSAANLVGKTIGSTTNSMSRYGVAVQGAANSNQRINSLVTNTNLLFGDMAKIAGSATLGSLNKLGASFGDLVEALGGLLANIGIVKILDSFTFAFQQLNSLISIGTSLLPFYNDALKESAKFNEETAKAINSQVQEIRSLNDLNAARARVGEIEKEILAIQKKQNTAIAKQVEIKKEAEAVTENLTNAEFNLNHALVNVEDSFVHQQKAIEINIGNYEDWENAIEFIQEDLKGLSNELELVTKQDEGYVEGINLNVEALEKEAKSGADLIALKNLLSVARAKEQELLAAGIAIDRAFKESVVSLAVARGDILPIQQEEINNNLMLAEAHEKEEANLINKTQLTTAINAHKLRGIELDKLAVKQSQKTGMMMIQTGAKTLQAFSKNAEHLKAANFALMMVDAFRISMNTWEQMSEIAKPPIPEIIAGLTFLSATKMAKDSLKYEQGGLVGGRRHAQGGTMIEAERGEFVMSRDAVDSIGVNNLQAMNAGRGGASIVINNPIISSEFVESELPELISEAVRKGADFGMS